MGPPPEGSDLRPAGTAWSPIRGVVGLGADMSPGYQAGVDSHSRRSSERGALLSALGSRLGHGLGENVGQREGGCPTGERADLGGVGHPPLHVLEARLVG